ncbi:BTB/POZ domain-containing protein 2-like isoform X2 [Ornithodoros turicata]|uniref:BTB/POZ domain-containing protein 2-like isoform X2 n=1 Tax=Ornithodoros turicata TaxID=34597 RepID=UPI0031396AD7
MGTTSAKLSIRREGMGSRDGHRKTGVAERDLRISRDAVEARTRARLRLQYEEREVAQCRYRRSTAGAADLCRCCKNCRWRNTPRMLGNTSSGLNGRSRCTQTELCGLQPFDTPSAPDVSLLLNSDDQKDVEIVVGTGRQTTRLPGHAMVLKNSPYLEDLIMNAHEVQREDGGCALKEIFIPYVEADVFQKVLQHLYTHDVHLESIPSALQVLSVAHDYVIHGLFIKCLDYINDHVSEDDVLEVLIQLSQTVSKIEPQENKLNEVRDRCLETIDMHAEKILKSAKFLELPYELMTRIILRGTLWVQSEMSVCKAMDRWTLEMCKRKEVDPNPETKQNILGPAVYFLRYFQMTKQELLDGPVAAGFLVQQDLSNIIDYMNKEIREEQLPKHLQDNLLLPKRVLSSTVKVPNLDRSASTAGARSCESVSASCHAEVKQRKSTSKKIIRGAGEVFWTLLSMLD